MPGVTATLLALARWVKEFTMKGTWEGDARAAELTALHEILRLVDEINTKLDKMTEEHDVDGS